MRAVASLLVGIAEHDLLELLHVLFELLHDRQVLIDDEVHQRIEDVAGPFREQVRRRLAALTDADV